MINKRVFKSTMFAVRQLKYLTNIQRVASQNKSVHNYLKLKISGESVQFPHVWLRDNCQCDECFHRSAYSRMLQWSNFDLNVKPKEIFEEDNAVKVTWSDGHTSVYDLNWLKFRRFTRESQQKYEETIYKPTKKTWNKETFNEVFTKHDYNDILNSDKALYDWLYNLSVYGVALIQNTPASETAVDAVVARVAFPKRTHYGVKFVVQNAPNANHVAHLTTNLQMHTDLTYYEYGPGSNLLHYLVQTQSKGGANLLSDGHYVAQYIKEHYPDQYKLLTDTEVEWQNIGEELGSDFFKLRRAPVIHLDMNGKISRINFSVSQRGSHFPVSLESVVPWYDAYTLFMELVCYYAVEIKTQTGDILVFDNMRLVHSRKAYEDSGNNVRKLIGAYLDWDEIYSRLRCLTRKLKKEEGL